MPWLIGREKADYRQLGLNESNLYLFLVLKTSPLLILNFR